MVGTPSTAAAVKVAGVERGEEAAAVPSVTEGDVAPIPVQKTVMVDPAVAG